jgi:cytochrome c oxidase cbb3-type subunit III
LRDGREERQLRLDPPIAEALDRVPLMQNGIGGKPPEMYFAMNKPYQHSAYYRRQALDSWFNL